MVPIAFVSAFHSLTNTPPFPWQVALYERLVSDRPDNIPSSCNLPTGLGKTSVIAIWLIALANGGKLPRRLVYVVNRRTVVDQTTDEVEKIRQNLAKAGLVEPLKELCSLSHETCQDQLPLAISTLRGQLADNREWSADPARPAVICGTVDMIGSRLLFNGYGVGFKGRPLHAGFLGQDVLLVHDEAHLEPAFQDLLVAIQLEQGRCKEFRSFHVMELSATSRGAETFSLSDEDRGNDEVKKRIGATKRLEFHPVVDEKKQLADKLVELALQHKDSSRAILLFVSKVDDVKKIVDRLKKDNQQTQQLMGTLRGLERDQMANPRKPEGCPIFARFLKRTKVDAPENEQWKIEPKTGTVYLVCTSAGEVGVNISADHLICDLSTFDSMAQRFGRVNRFGECADTRIDIVYPAEFKDDNELNVRRKRTLALLQSLNGDGSPAALSSLDPIARLDAFAPKPVIFPVTDILFDAWTLTTIRDKLPGRPPVEPYLHGKAEWQAPETYVAWREEVGKITGPLLEKYKPEDLLEVYPLKPHELLRDRTDRVLKQLSALAKKHATSLVWLLDDFGQVETLTLADLVDTDKKDRLAYRTVLLPPAVGGLRNGMLDAASEVAEDVADEWFDDRGDRRRIRIWSNDPDFTAKSESMRRIRPPIQIEDGDDEEAEVLSWHWFERSDTGDGDGSDANKKSVAWRVHTDDVVRNVTAIVEKLSLSSELRRALILAARWHDLGKKREIWQRSIGNPNPANWLAKSGKDRVLRELTGYRHEFGSLVDVTAGHEVDGEDVNDFKSLHLDLQDLVLHLIAAHHGYGRPHFPEERAFDPEPKGQDITQLAADVPRRFVRLQRKYGRWGLAYLESLLRAADWAASARPSQEEQI